MLQPIGGSETGGELQGLEAVAERASLPRAAKIALGAEILALGAVHVQELSAEDWQGLGCWAMLRPFEQRRLLATLAWFASQ